MAGGVITWKIEVEFVAGSGTFVDLTAYVRQWSIDRPDYKETGDGEPTVATIVFNNDPPASGVSPLSPDSPLTTWYPNITRDRLVRITALWAGGASTSVRFFGWSDEWIPDAGDNPPETAIVTLTASCVLSRYARRKMLSTFGERSIYIDPLTTYYPFDDAPDSDFTRVVSRTPAGAFNGQVIAPAKYPGSAQFGSPDGGHLTDGQIEFSRGNDNAPAPVVLIPVRDFASAGWPVWIAAWYRLGADPAGSLGDDMLTAYDSKGRRLWVWSVKLVGGNVVWTLYDNAGTTKSFIDTGAPRDDGWHYWAIYLISATQTAIYSRNKGEAGQAEAGSFVWTTDPRQVKYLVVGGQMPPNQPGKQSNTFQGSISSLAVQYIAADSADQGNPGVVKTNEAYKNLLSAIATPISAPIGGSISTSGDTTPVMFSNQPKNMLEAFNLVARTVSGNLITDPDGRRWYMRATDVRQPTVQLTLDAEADLSAPDGGWQGVKAPRPTRITVSSPLGNVDVIDSTTEAVTGLELEGSGVDTVAGSLAVARGIGGRFINGGASRISSFGVDATLTATDKTTALMALVQTQRIRITNLPSGLTGYSYLDVYAAGWKEEASPADNSYRFTFSSYPADDPPEAVYDDAEYGRFGLTSATGANVATITGGTCIGNTGTGTVIITSASGVLTTNVASYPMDLDWNGERITVSGVGGGTSPQTVTVSARGVAPSVARIHTTGQTVDIWHSWTWGP